ncbi:CGNR zinc finger domain-containing protein [Bradyrhizobium tropiciagri]|uniref:CGNR zinc finger domain-containing protein n=1 Tax=Bradyrhizobium tropiciagri TaxID=312253 RepID=UPI001BAB397C|nr:ABATE domain-containing protein [Bradyrhizobium tropiciagri]MBR0896841.1 CGNR zinc finger domain-containing protein [Bradyrhizobium tropiciagri]
MFIADSLGLDFINSIATPVDTPVDWIADGDGLLRWLTQAKLVPSDVLDEIKARSAQRELDEVAGQARDLREWFRGFVRKHMGRPLTARALRELESLNRLLESDQAFSKIVPHRHDDHDGFALERTRRWHSAETLLLPIGEAMARVVCEESFSDIKACEGPACTLMFADHTRARARRWCSMAICGNRAKQAAHRSRMKDKG